jgi:hypothetical protein
MSDCETADRPRRLAAPLQFFMDSSGVPPWRYDGGAGETVDDASLIRACQVKQYFCKSWRRRMPVYQP